MKKQLSAVLSAALLLPAAAVTAGAAAQLNELTIEVHTPDIYTEFAPEALVSVPGGADYAITYAAYYDHQTASTDALRFAADETHDVLLTVQANSGFVFSDEADYWFDGGSVSGAVIDALSDDKTTVQMVLTLTPDSREIGTLYMHPFVITPTLGGAVTPADFHHFDEYNMYDDYYNNVEDIVHASSQWQVQNSDGSWSDYSAATYETGVYRCAYTLWIEPYRDKAQFAGDTLNIEIDADATQAAVVNSTEGEWRQTVVVYSREYVIDPSKVVTYDTVTATVALNPVCGAPVYGSFPEWSIAEEGVYLQSLSWEKKNPDGSFSWVEGYEENVTFEEGIYRANLLFTALAFPDGGAKLTDTVTLTLNGGAPQTVSVTHFSNGQDGEYGSYIHYTQEFTVTGGGSSIFILGDANGDYAVNIRDVTAMQRHLAGFPTAEPFNEAAADLDGDGVSVSDATLLQQYLADFETDVPIGSIVVISVN